MIFFFSFFSQQQIQDAADQGVLFVGFVQEPYGARIREPDSPSVSLHSSPTSVLRSLSIGSRSSLSSPINQAAAGETQEAAEKPPSGNAGNSPGSELGGSVGGASPAASPVSEENEAATEDDSPCHNNNKDREGRSRRARADGE